MSRKPVRRDENGIEFCYKKVDGFPCRHLLGHTQGCDVDWDAAYPDADAEDFGSAPETGWTGR